MTYLQTPTIPIYHVEHIDKHHGSYVSPSKKKKKENEYKLSTKIVVTCFFWYIFSAISNMFAKMTLNMFNYPTTVSMAHNLAAVTLLPPIMSLYGIKKTHNIKRSYLIQYIIPLAIGKFLATTSSQFSIAKIPLSYSHTIKASMPIWTVILSRLLMKKSHSYTVYLSLLPIVLGICLATVTEMLFDLQGLLFALFATLNFSLQNIYCKKVINDTGLHQLHLLKKLSEYSFCLLLPAWIVLDSSNWSAQTFQQIEHPKKLLFYMILDAVCNFLQSMCAFNVIRMITPLSYSVANCCKRILVISVSIYIMGNPTNAVNKIGMVTAIFGVWCYQKAKNDENARNSVESENMLSDTSFDSLLSNNDVRISIDDHPKRQERTLSSYYRNV